MRKNRFLLNLIAATAIGLSVFGCDSSSSGGIGDTSDVAVANNTNVANETLRLREYMLVGQRGVSTFTTNPDANQSIPPNFVGDVFGGTSDAEIDTDRARLYELGGIAEVPIPNARIEGPGDPTSSPNTPTVDATTGNQGTTGYHVMEASPTGAFAIGISRARARGFAADTVNQTQLQIFSLDIPDPLDQVFPPNLSFGTPPTNTPIRFFNEAPIDQGEFVSGTWGPTGLVFYASINSQIFTISVNGTTGDMTFDQTVPFPNNGARNNAAQMIATANGLFAIDNLNGSIIRWDRDATSGQLSNPVTTATVADPHGFTIDRSGGFLYVVGRESRSLAGYQIAADGTLTQIQVAANTPGAVPAVFADRLGDVDSNPQLDQVVLADYDRGVLQTYSVNTTTGLLTAIGVAGTLTSGDTKTGNIEIEPTGRFVLTAQEAFEEDLDGLAFANLDSATNGTNGGNADLSAVGIADADGRIAFATSNPTLANAQNGSLQAFRIDADGTLVFISREEADNPHGLSFFNRVLTPPAGAFNINTNQNQQPANTTGVQ